MPPLKACMAYAKMRFWFISHFSMYNVNTVYNFFLNFYFFFSVLFDDGNELEVPTEELYEDEILKK